MQRCTQVEEEHEYQLQLVEYEVIEGQVDVALTNLGGSLLSSIVHKGIIEDSEIWLMVVMMMVVVVVMVVMVLTTTNIYHKIFDWMLISIPIITMMNQGNLRVERNKYLPNQKGIDMPR